MLRLVQFRKARGISQTKLCQLTGIAPADISAMETGRRHASPGWRKRIAAALNVENPDWLFEEVDDGAPADQRAGGSDPARNST